MRSDIVPGGVFPDYALPDHTGTVRTLGELQGRDPLILTLARGHYCPKEHQQHLELAAFQPKVAVAYTQIVTISTDERHTLQEFRASVGAWWTFLSDPGRIVQRDLQIQERLTVQVADWLVSTLRPLGAAVLLEAEHLCMAIRGAHVAGTSTRTFATRGVLAEPGPLADRFFA